MQTKKKAGGRSASREHASPRVSRIQKKYSENVQTEEKKVSELITSSARKTRCGKFPFGIHFLVVYDAIKMHHLTANLY